MHHTNLRIPHDLAAIVGEIAARQERSRNRQIVYLIRRGLEADGHPHDLTQRQDGPADGR